MSLVETGTVSRHLVSLPGTGWTLWRSVSVRGAGFPAVLVDELAAPEAAATADVCLAARAWRAACLEPFVDRLAADLRRVPARARKPLRDLRTRVRLGQPVDPGDGDDACLAARASADALAARATFDTAYRHAVEAIEQRLIAIGQDPAFREAMSWQGAEAARCIAQAIDVHGRAVRRRQALKQIARRVQRYAAKNDTIGFFGPYGWGRFDDEAQGIETSPGAAPVASREVFFEGWSIDSLARSLESRHALRPWIAPRLKAGVWIHRGMAYRPLRSPLRLGTAECALLALCDGVRTATEIARLAPPGAFELLDRLVAADIIAWRLEVAPQLYPERELRDRLTRIDDALLREPCLADLDDLLHARATVASAAGDADRVDAALADLERCFTRITAQPSSRRAGQTYGARALVYEDCRRDDEVRIGPAILADLAQPLGLMLDVARWASAELSVVLREHLRRCVAELRAQQQMPELDCHTFVSYVVSSVWLDGRARLFDAVVARMQWLWDEVLGSAWDPSAAHVAMPLEATLTRAHALFPPRPVDWSLGRYVSPDLLIAASGLDAIRRGDYTVVLGEVHGGNSLSQFIDVATHPNPDELFESAAADGGDETVILRAVPRALWIPRLTSAVVLPHHWRYLYGDDLPNHPPCRELPAAKLVVVETRDGILARARDGSLEFDAVELFGNPLLGEVNRVMGDLRPPLPHTPRLSLGRLTIARERWHATPSQMPFLTSQSSGDEAQQFLDLRAWGRACGMPRRVFVKTANERKPWLLDFDSPIYADMFCSIMRTVPPEATVALVEMLPGPQDLWLVDRAGRRFTCELRCVARHRDDQPHPSSE